MCAAHSAASLNLTHVLVFIFFIVPVIPRWNAELLTLFSKWFSSAFVLSLKHPTATGLQISFWPALISFGREFPEGRLHIIWVREERKWWERWEHREQPTAWPSSWKWLWIRQRPAFLPAFKSLLKTVDRRIIILRQAQSISWSV